MANERQHLNSISMKGNKNSLGYKHSPETRKKMSNAKSREKHPNWNGGVSLNGRSEYLKSVKKIVYDHYGWRCNCCNETTPQFLSVDHINNDGYLDKNKSGKRLTGLPLYSKIVRENFGDRYQILCMNCNYGKRMNNGICPHEEIYE